MKIEYNNLYTHFILITQNRYPLITERQRERIERDVERQIEAQDGTNSYQGESSFCDSARGQ